jgi:hypothetical protein
LLNFFFTLFKPGFFLSCGDKLFTYKMKQKDFKILCFGLAFFTVIGIQAQKLNKQSIKKATTSVNLSEKKLQQQPDFQLTPETIRGLDETGYARCLTVENEELLKAANPNRLSNVEFEAWLAPKLEQVKSEMTAGRRAVYNIPVVIHIVHNGNSINTNGSANNENISDAQAISQIQVLNEDYRRMAGTNGGVNSTGAAVDVEINFCLAVTDPNGNPTTGIVRHNITPYSNTQTTGVTDDWEIRTDVEQLKAATQWDPEKYMNMWSIKPGGNSLNHPTNPGLSGLLGYAQFPSNSGLGGLNTSGGNANTDGVVAGYNAFGTDDLDDGSFVINSSYNLGRTMTHEVGHWLGLRHIWGDTSSCGGNGDYCDDTPDSNTANYDCQAVTHCSSADQYQNYMDYSYDYCMDTFTADQKARVVTVMLNSPRRMELNNSTACQAAAPYIKFGSTTGNASEGTDCTFTDFDFSVDILQAPTGAATVTFNIDSGSATNTTDYEIVNNTVTFANGATDSQNLTIRVFNDGLIEGDETIQISMSLSGSTNASLDSNADTINITITDDDFAPSTSNVVDVYDEDFEETTGLAGYDRDQDGNAWYVGVTGLETFGDISGATAVSESDGTILGTGGAYTPDNYLLSEIFTIPAATSATVSYVVGAYSNTGSSYQEHYSVYFTTIETPTAYSDLEEYSLELDREIPADGTEIITHDLTAYVGMAGRLVIRHHNSAGAGLLLWDSINVDTVSGTDVQTAVNTGLPEELLLNAMGTAPAYDTASGFIMAQIQNNNSFDYGCINVSVLRAGLTAQSYNGSSTANYVTDKAFRITTGNTTNSGNVTSTFYFTNDEIAGWESVTERDRSELFIMREVAGSVVESLPATIGAFGSYVTVSAAFTSATGDYYFGTSETLSINSSNFEIFSLYPNPTTGEVTISLSSDQDVNVALYDIRGRKVFANTYRNNATMFTKTISFESIASGMYLLEVQSGSKKTTKKIVKQ